MTAPSVSSPADAATCRRFRVHYHRKDGDYKQASLWVWGAQPHGGDHAEEVLAAHRNSFGAVFEVDCAHFGGEAALRRGIGFVPRIRRSWELKDGPDRFWHPRLGAEVWIVEGDPALYTEKPEVVRHIHTAVQDDPRRIVLTLSHRLEVKALTKETVRIERAEGEALAVAELRPHEVRLERAAAIEVILAEEVDCIAEKLLAHAGDLKPCVVMPRGLQFDAERFDTDARLGAEYAADATTFRLFSPAAQAARVVLYDAWEGDAGRREIAMKSRGKGLWEVRVEGDLEGTFYALAVDTHAQTPGPEVVDPFAINTVGRNDRARITDLRRTDPEGFRPIQRPELPGHPVDAVIYEVSVRDFTIDEGSGVSEQHRGLYLGFVEPRAALPEDPTVATGMEHLRQMGVTHVQILPVQDFDNDEQDPEYNWGYMTAFFNSPEGWYATDIRGPERIIELKRMIQELHRAKIGVILDVVYNHTGVLNTFERITPNYYHRQWEYGGFSNGSGTGNEVNSSAPMVRRFLLDSMRFWVEEYGVDGFRLDLMGLMDLDTLVWLREELLKVHPHLLFYGEPWTGGATPMHRIADKAAVSGTGIAAFNDHFRNALKGEPDGANPGYVQNGSQRDGVCMGLLGGIGDWTSQPGESINYATCHDNLTMWDKLLESTRARKDDRIRMACLAAGILCVSQGMLFLHGGHEFLRTKDGDDNSYNSGDEVNRFDWLRKSEHADVFRYIRNMIALRRAHPVLRLRTADEIRERAHFHHEALPAPECIMLTLRGDGVAGESWSEAAICINPTRKPLRFHLPEEGVWRIHASGLEASPWRPLGSASGADLVPRHSLAVLAR